MRALALLRGINVGGNKKVPMDDLREVAAKTGLADVRTYINSGNLVFEIGLQKDRKLIEAALEKSIQNHFGFSVEVVVRTASQWKKYASGSPFPAAEKARPSLLLLGLSKLRCSKQTCALLKERAIHGEQIKIVGDAIWVDFVNSVGQSKLTPAWIDKAAGSTVTMRNWRTVLKLAEMTAQTKVPRSFR